MHLLLGISFASDISLDPVSVREAAGVERTGDLRDRHVREFSRVIDPTHPDNIRELQVTLRDSVRKRERLWLLMMTPTDRAHWELWLAPDLLHELGPVQAYEGQQCQPIGVAPRLLVPFLLERGRPEDLAFLHHALTGLDALLVSASTYRGLTQAGIRLQHRFMVTRILTNPKFLAYAVVLIYSALRVLPVSYVREFHGSLLLLWLIDLTTAIPYTWGVLTMVTAAHFLKRMAGLAVTVITFVAPYVYFGLNGKDYPGYVIVIIALLIASAFVLEGFKYWLDRRANRQLSSIEPD